MKAIIIGGKSYSRGEFKEAFEKGLFNEVVIADTRKIEPPELDLTPYNFLPPKQRRESRRERRKRQRINKSNKR